MRRYQIAVILVVFAAADFACVMATRPRPRSAVDDARRREEASTLLMHAHSAYIAGHFTRAKTLSQRLQDLYGDYCPARDKEIILSGWAVMVAAACQLGDGKLARHAFRLDPRRAQLVRPICEARGIRLATP
jgi:hypothetical protein